MAVKISQNGHCVLLETSYRYFNVSGQMSALLISIFIPLTWKSYSLKSKLVLTLTFRSAFPRARRRGGRGGARARACGGRAGSEWLSLVRCCRLGQRPHQFRGRLVSRLPRKKAEAVMSR